MTKNIRLSLAVFVYAAHKHRQKYAAVRVRWENRHIVTKWLPHGIAYRMALNIFHVIGSINQLLVGYKLGTSALAALFQL